MIKFSDKKQAIDKAKEVLKIAKEVESNKKNFVWVTNGKTSILTRKPEFYIKQGYAVCR